MTPGQAPDPAARSAMRENMQKETADLRKVLTPDQQKTFDKNVEDMRNRRRDRSGS
jgi:Spy/CpxP family protein refolding chaperone